MAMGLPDFFSNESAETDGKTAVESPAFSLTKVQASLGTLIVAIAGAVAKLEGTTSVKIAAIGAGALVMVGVFGLAAADLIARQRAAEAKLRWGPEAKKAAATPATGSFYLYPESDDLVLRKGHAGDMYDIDRVKVEGEKVTLIAHRGGKKDLEPTFQPRA
jgi:hypothetical protein